MDFLTLSAFPGTYLLWLNLPEVHTLPVGQLGPCVFDAGLYAYVGSAFGPGGVRARVGRHLRRDKPPHWHIDFLTAAAPVVAVWLNIGPQRLECAWALTLAALPSVSLPVTGFGSSDCRCLSHLFCLPGELIPQVRQALEPQQAFVVQDGFTFLA